MIAGWGRAMIRSFDEKPTKGAKESMTVIKTPRNTYQCNTMFDQGQYAIPRIKKALLMDKSEESFRANGDELIIDEREMMKIAMHAAIKKNHLYTISTDLLEDLIGDLWLVAMSARETFDSNSDAKYTTYLYSAYSVKFVQQYWMHCRGIELSEYENKILVNVLRYMSAHPNPTMNELCENCGTIDPKTNKRRMVQRGRMEKILNVDNCVSLDDRKENDEGAEADDRYDIEEEIASSRSTASLEEDMHSEKLQLMKDVCLHCMNQLPPKTKELFVALNVQGTSRADFAKQHGYSIESVRHVMNFLVGEDKHHANKKSSNDNCGIFKEALIWSMNNDGKLPDLSCYEEELNDCESRLFPKIKAGKDIPSMPIPDLEKVEPKKPATIPIKQETLGNAFKAVKGKDGITRITMVLDIDELEPNGDMIGVSNNDAVASTKTIRRNLF